MSHAHSHKYGGKIGQSKTKIKSKVLSTLFSLWVDDATLMNSRFDVLKNKLQLQSNGSYRYSGIR